MLAIQVSPLLGRVPKIKISPTFIHCTSKAREEMDAWLLARFGTKEQSYKIGNTLVVSPATFKQLMEYTNEQKRQSLYRLYRNPSNLF